MADVMTYKEYVARIEIDLEAGILHGEVINLRDVITFQAASVEQLQTEFATSVEDYLAFCAARHREPEKPYSGNVMLRMSPDMHRTIVTQAAKAGMSINRWLVAKIQEAIQDETYAVTLPLRQTYLEIVSSTQADLLQPALPQLILGPAFGTAAVSVVPNRANAMVLNQEGLGYGPN